MRASLASLLLLMASFGASPVRAETPPAEDTLAPQETRGVDLTLQTGGAWRAGEVAVNLTPAVELSAGWAEIKLQLPVYARALGPLLDDAPQSEPICQWLQCIGWQEPSNTGPQWQPRGLAQLFGGARLGLPGGPFFLALESQRQELGLGTVVNGAQSTMLTDQPGTGLFANARLPVAGGLELTATTLDVWTPLSLSAVMVNLKPFASEPNSGPIGIWFSQFELQWTGTLDQPGLSWQSLPIHWRQPDHQQELRALIPVVPTGHLGDLQVSVGSQLGWGHRRSTWDWQIPGFGVDAGLRGRLRTPWAGVTASLLAGWDGPGHRHFGYGPFWILERQGVETVPNGGLGALADVAFSSVLGSGGLRLTYADDQLTPQARLALAFGPLDFETGLAAQWRMSTQTLPYLMATAEVRVHLAPFVSLIARYRYGPESRVTPEPLAKINSAHQVWLGAQWGLGLRPR